MKSCLAGNEFICEGARTESYGPDDTGIRCGSGAGAFDIVDQGTHNRHAIHVYNAAGDLTRRHLRSVLLPVQQPAHQR